MNNKGFTLFEVIIVVALLGVVMLIIFSPISFSFKNFGKQNERASITSNAREAMDYLTRQIRKANQINIANENDKIIMDAKEYYVDKGNLVAQNTDLIGDVEVIIEGIDGLHVEKNGDKITLKITIEDSKGKSHELSSIMYIR